MEIQKFKKDELPKFYANYWINAIENGRVENPFREKVPMAQIANEIHALKTKDTIAIFSEEEKTRIVERAQILVTREQTSKKGYIYNYTLYGSPIGSLKELFEGFEIPKGRFPFEESVMYIPSKAWYFSLIENRLGTKVANKRAEIYPGGDTDGVFCRYIDPGDWKIIAAFGD